MSYEDVIDQLHTMPEEYPYTTVDSMTTKYRTADIPYVSSSYGQTLPSSFDGYASTTCQDQWGVYVTPPILSTPVIADSETSFSNTISTDSFNLDTYIQESVLS